MSDKSSKVEEVVEKVEETVKETVEDVKEGASSMFDKCLNIISPITDKVRSFVLGFGEIILTISVIIGLVSAILAGVSEMGNVGFFTGLSSMLQGMISVVMGALVIFLLFAIKKNTDK